jgi:hypothetical protein
MKYILIFIFVLLTNSVFSQSEFTSDKYNFKIIFPSDWTVKEGKDNMVVDAEKNYYTKFYVMIAKLDVPESATIYSIPIDTFEQKIEAKYSKKYYYYEVIKYGDNTIDYVDAYYFFVRYAGETENFMDKYVSYQYQFIYKKYFYSLIATCPEKKFEKLETEFNKIFSSFTFLSKKYR